MFSRSNEISELVFAIYSERAQDIDNAGVVVHREDLERMLTSIRTTQLSQRKITMRKITSQEREH